MTGLLRRCLAAAAFAPALAASLCLAQKRESGASAEKSAAPAPANGPSANGSTSGDGGAAAQPRFDIFEYVVDGNTVLPVTEIESAVYPYLGEQRTAGDVDKAREALETAYIAKGFQTVQVEIPQQGVETGIIHLRVVENPVGRLRVVGSKYHSLAAIKAEAPSLAPGTVPSAAALQADIATLNAQPDLKVTPRLVAGRAPGTVDVELDVEDKLPVHASLEINNQHSPRTSDLRTIGTVSYGNLWQRGHSISLSYQVAPQNTSDARVFSGNYLVPLPREQLNLLVYGVQSNSNVTAIAGTTVLGKGGIIGLRAIKSLPGEEGFYQSVTFGVDRKDLTQNVVTFGVPSDAPVLYYPMTLAYAATQQDGETTTQANASVNFAIPGINSNAPKFDVQRFQARADYIYFRADASRVQPLPLGLVAYVKASGQVTGDSLLSSEQFSAGGLSSVRGYLEAERIGDYGAQATVELRSPSLVGTDTPHISDLRTLAFFDGATVLLRQPLPEEKSSYRLSSFGVGTRLTGDIVNADAEFAVPMIAGDVTRAWNPFLHFRVWSEF